MLGSHVLDHRLHTVGGKGAVAVVGRTEKVCRLGNRRVGMFRVRVVAQAGRAREALLAVGTIIVLVTVVFLKFLVAVE
jgi:hypothetical protein